MRSDHRHLTAYQVSCEVGQPIILILRPAILDRHILAFDVPAFADALPECGHKTCSVGGRRAAEELDYRHRRLLRARSQRPRGSRAAECDQQLPPSDGDCHTPPSRARCVEERIPRQGRAVLPFKEGRTLVAATSVDGFNCRVARDSMSLGGVDQRRVKPLRIHRLVQKAASSGADLAPRIAADEERWNRESWNRERAAEPFDGVDSGHSS